MPATHLHHAPPPAAARPLDQTDRGRAIERVTVRAICTNAFLSISQVVVGLLANSFSLVADAVHTLSDLFTDVLVLFAGRRGANPADDNHPYGHERIETAVSMLLGVILVGVGIGFLLSSGVRLQNMGHLPPLHPAALAMAVGTLAAKEVLFRYTLAAGRRLKAPLLEANAWHARSDAASSLVVAIGIGGSLAGYPFLEPLAAALVGFLIVRMGLQLTWTAIRELIDTGLPEEELDRLRETICATPGVIGLHDLRTRRMAHRVLCDAHVQVSPRITVSEGHRISDAVYFRVREAHPDIQEVLVHVDPEEDRVLQVVPPGPLPERAAIEAVVRELVDGIAPPPSRVQVHYLGNRVELEIFLAAGAPAGVDADALKRRIAALISARPVFRNISFVTPVAP